MPSRDVMQILRFAPLALLIAAAAPPPVKSPAEIVAEAPASAWVPIPTDALLVMDLAPAAGGTARRVIIQLMPPPFARGHIANIRTLARARWWDGTRINRVQDNYVVQWGDATEKKPLPPGMRAVAEAEYETTAEALSEANATELSFDGRDGVEGLEATLEAFRKPLDAAGRLQMADTMTAEAPDGWHQRDSYAEWVEIYGGWPLGSQDDRFWPLHCYGMVGVGRNMPPDTGTGAELYVVIGESPRHLDRNIALVGRVIEGIEHLSALPRGTGSLGFYETPQERVTISRVRLASELAEAERPRFEMMNTESESFALTVAARANRRDAFFLKPAGGVDICNLPVPVRRAATPQR